jgi:hypothetical protein
MYPDLMPITQYYKRYNKTKNVLIGSLLYFKTHQTVLRSYAYYSIGLNFNQTFLVLHTGSTSAGEDAKPYMQDQQAILLGFHGAMNMMYLKKVWHLFKSARTPN